MKKNDWKYLVDSLLFVDICSIAAIGLLLAFVIPSGGGHADAKYFMGLHRHDWGDIHLYLALLMIGLLVLHVWLSWTWVVNTTRSYFGQNWQKALWALCGAWLVVLLISWAVVIF